MRSYRKCIGGKHGVGVFFRVTSAVMALTGMASWMDSIACLSFRGEVVEAKAYVMALGSVLRLNEWTGIFPSQLSYSTNQPAFSLSQSIRVTTNQPSRPQG